MSNNTSTIETAERLLNAAGIATTPVIDCADRRCEWCRPGELPLAA
ncbi:MAG: hypothetical protein HKN80_13135 [Acidimicrobiia bacterium]|nr:hypothetical protein [Acidimicrobiia bacterium]